MASYHMSVSMIGRSSGKSAIGGAAYRSGAVLTDPDTGEVMDYSRKGGISDTFILTPEGAPEWAGDRQALWSAVHAKESRKNSQLAREFTIALPHELGAEGGAELVSRWAQDELVSRGMVVDVAIHDPAPREGDPRNLHAHVMCTTRELDPDRPDGWAKGKNRTWNDPATLERWRASWADAQNLALAKAGASARVDHRTLADQRADAEARGDEIGVLVLSRPPEPRLGVVAGSLETKGMTTDRGNDLREARRDREQLLVLADAARAAQGAEERAEIEMSVATTFAAIRAHAEEEGPQVRDLTKTAVERQLKGMGLPAYELTIFGGDRPHTKVMTPAEILSDLPRLKRANKSGSSIVIRGPRDQDHDLVLLDDLDRFTPDRMKDDGLNPAAVIETSPGSFQAWIKLGEPQPAPIRHEAARILAQKYGADPAAVDPHKSGRLAGFTNPKPEHRTRRGSPFVLLHRFAGAIAERAADLIAAARDSLTRRAEVAAITAAPTPNSDLVAWWKAGQDAVPPPRDLSAVDWHLCHVALASGRAPEDVAAALEVSADRKGKAASRYAEKTVGKAVAERTARQHVSRPADPFKNRPRRGPSGPSGPSLG